MKASIDKIVESETTCQKRADRIYSEIMNSVKWLYKIEKTAREITDILSESTYGILGEVTFKTVKEMTAQLSAMQSSLALPINNSVFLLIAHMELIFPYSEKVKLIESLEGQAKDLLPICNAIGKSVEDYIHLVQRYVGQMILIQKVNFGEKSKLDEEKIRHMVACFKKVASIRIEQQYKDEFGGM